MAKKSMILEQRLLLSSLPASTTAASCAAAPTLTCMTTVSAVSASASWLTRARSPVSARHLSKKKITKMAQEKLDYVMFFC